MFPIYKFEKHCVVGFDDFETLWFVKAQIFAFLCDNYDMGFHALLEIEGFS